MKRLIALTGCLVCFCFFQPFNCHGQAYVQYSLQDGSNRSDLIKVVNGEAYVMQGIDQFGLQNRLRKHAADGSLVYSVDIPIDPMISVRAMEVINGEVYLLSGKSSYFFCCATTIQAVKVSANGSIIFNQVITDTTSTHVLNPDCDVFPEITIRGNEWIISAWVTGLNFPTTMGGLIQNDYNLFILKLNATTGETIRSMAIPGLYHFGWEYFNSKVVVENGFLYTAVTAYKNDLPVTIGNLPTGISTHVYLRKINLSNFSTVFSRYLAADSSSTATDFLVKNGEYHIIGTYSSQKPAFYAKLYANGSLALSKTIDLPSTYILPTRLKLSSNHVYIAGETFTSNQQYSSFAFKLNFDGSIVYQKNNPTTGSWGQIYGVPMEVVGDDLYLAGTGAAATYPITNNSNYLGQHTTGYITHYGPSGNMVFSSFVNPVDKMEIQNNKIYLAGTAQLAANPSTDGSQIKGPSDAFLTVLKPDGTPVYNGYFGGSKYEYVSDFDVDNGNVFFVGSTDSPDFLTTEPAVLQDSTYRDGFLTKISFCPDRYDTASDTLSPAVQTVCKYGLAQIINGTDLIVPADSLPITYANAVQSLQYAVSNLKYQWQRSISPSGPWINIQGATDRDYRPVIGAVNEYFRRQAFLSSDCNSAFIHTSDIASVFVNTFTAPQLNFESPVITCPLSSVQLKGTAAVTGGQPPYTYSWDMGLPSIADPVITPSVNTVYTLLLRDMAGCEQLGQVVVSVYRANAGPDKSVCGGSPIRIGTAALPGSSSITYDWTPAVGLDNSTISRPMADPLSVTDYALTVSLTKQDGSICITHDTITVTPVAAPVNLQFAGADKVICYSDSVMIGAPSEPGFTYSWSPATYLAKSDTAQTYFLPASPQNQMPVPNPATVYAYAKKDGCTFSDTVVVATIEASAGPGLCMAGLIGTPDRTPGIPELYSWELLSGPGNFLGPTNAPMVPVSESLSGTSFYRLTVSYQGTSCYSETAVSNLCDSICTILVDCAGDAGNGGQTTLVGTSFIPDGIYSWEPQVGLSAYTGNRVHLTDTVSRTYTLSVVSAQNPSSRCSVSITTNSGSPAPAFLAPDTITCANVPVTIGAPTEPGYTYEWTGTGLSNNHISDPVATVSRTTSFFVTVINTNGCKVRDTVLVTVPNNIANAGPDRLVCGNAIVTLGTDSLPNTTYSWDPQAAPWQNGTDQFSANPQVLSAVTVTYTLTTNTAGCTSSDETTITVNNSPLIGDAPDRAICAGSGNSIGSPPIAGVTYLWSPAAGLNDPTSSRTFANPATTTTYTLTATFPGDCVVPATDEVIVTVKDLSFNMEDIQFCPQNGAVQLGANVPTGMSYLWQPNNLVTNFTIRNPQTINPPPNNITNLVLRIGDGTCFYSDTMQLIPVTDLPLVSADRTVCKGHSVQIGSDANTTAATINYQWSPADYLDDPASPNPRFTSPNVGTYQYVLTKTDNSIPCFNRDTVNLTVVDIIPEINTIPICRNSCTEIGTPSAEGITFLWTPETGLSDPSSSNPLACIDSNNAVYTLTVSDGLGCVAMDTITLSVLNVAGIDISVANVTACIGEPDVRFTPTINTGSYSWLWAPDDNTLSNINIPDPVIQTAASGSRNYTLEIIDNGTGCTQLIPVSATINECSTFGGAGNYVWIDSNGNGIQDIFERGAATVAIRLYNEAGYLMATSVTDLVGNYHFENVIPGNDYYIVFESPVGYSFTIQNAGGVAATNNSKADASGRTGSFDLAAGEAINDMDAGLLPAGPVPVSLLSFRAALQNKEVILKWQTANENNCQYFYIERSTNGSAFSTIGRVNGHGTTSTSNHYQFTDQHPMDGYNFYRLKQADFDGKFVYSHVERVRLASEEPMSVYYNSTSNSVHLHLTEIKNNITLRLLAANGQLLFHKKEKGGMTDYKFSLPFLSSGIYFLQLNVDGHLQTKKIKIVR